MISLFCLCPFVLLQAVAAGHFSAKARPLQNFVRCIILCTSKKCNCRPGLLLELEPSHAACFDRVCCWACILILVLFCLMPQQWQRMIHTEARPAEEQLGDRWGLFLFFSFAAHGDFCGWRSQIDTAWPGATLHHAQWRWEESQAQWPAWRTGLQSGKPLDSFYHTQANLHSQRPSWILVDFTLFPLYSWTTFSDNHIIWTQP